VQFDPSCKYRIKVARELIGGARAQHASCAYIFAKRSESLVNGGTIKVVNIASTNLMKRFFDDHRLSLRKRFVFVAEDAASVGVADLERERQMRNLRIGESIRPVLVV
jgi:hypothetical protein